jgi:hypothetical protein
MTSRPAALDHLARTSLTVLVGLLAVLVLAGCGGGDGASETPSGPSAPAVFDDPASLVAAIADTDGATVTVRGFLIATEDGAQLCGIVLESYPPQCGGPTLTVSGEVPQAVVDGLDRTTDPGQPRTWWGWVRITGTVAAGDGAPSIAIDSIELDEGP